MDNEGDAKPDAGPLEARATKVVIGDYASQGPFAGIDGQKGNKKPIFEPSGQSVPGADSVTGKIRYFGWPPNLPATFQRLGFGTFGKSWEKTIEGMRVGGIRQVIITAPYLSKDPMDYVIVLTAMRPKAGNS